LVGSGIDELISGGRFKVTSNYNLKVREGFLQNISHELAG